jgi:putative tricarboxylic transport membrane protein
MKTGVRNWVDVLASLFFGFIGVGVIVGAIKLRIGTATEPQPGFFPFLGGIALILLCIILLFQAWRGRTAAHPFGELKRPAILILGLVFYVAVMDFLGYVIATVILSALVLFIMDTERWWVLVGVSLFLSLGTFYLFDRLLAMPLPEGLLAGIL